MCFLDTEDLRGFAPKPPAGTPSLHPFSPSSGGRRNGRKPLPSSLTRLYGCSVPSRSFVPVSLPLRVSISSLFPWLHSATVTCITLIQEFDYITGIFLWSHLSAEQRNSGRWEPMGLFLRVCRNSVKSRKISTEPEKCRLRSEFFALSTAIFAVRKCADRSDQERRKHFFLRFFWYYILKTYPSFIFFPLKK